MEKQTFVFGKKNYIIMAIGIGIMILGYILMSGGGSDDPNQFNADIFNAQRIGWAPFLILTGLLALIYTIMSKPSRSNE